MARFLRINNNMSATQTPPLSTTAFHAGRADWYLDRARLELLEAIYAATSAGNFRLARELRRLAFAIGTVEGELKELVR